MSASLGRWFEPRRCAVLLCGVAALAVAGCETLEDTGLSGRRAPAAAGAEGAASYETVMRLAAASQAAGDYPAAIQLYRRAAGMESRRVEPPKALGQVLFEAGQYNEALDAFRAARNIAPNDAEVLRGLGNVYINLDQLPQAREVLTTAQSLAPSDWRIANSLGVLNDLDGQHAAAQEQYRTGLAIEQDNLLLRNNLGLSLALSGDYQQATAELRRVTADPRATAAHRQNLALVLGLSGQTDAARRMGRMDLGEREVRSNVAYYEILRALTGRQRSSAIGVSPTPSGTLAVPNPARY